VKRRDFLFEPGLIGGVEELVTEEDDWLLRLFDEVEEELDSDRDRLSASISSKLTLFALSNMELFSSMCSVNFEITILRKYML